jgi:hypothetical protein
MNSTGCGRKRSKFVKSTLSAFAWRDGGKESKTVVRTVDSAVIRKPLEPDLILIAREINV